MFVINDEWHAEWVGKFETKKDALAELHRLAATPWDEAPNQAPCTSWRTCGRRYNIVEYDDRFTPWRVLSRATLLEIDGNGVRWLGERG